MTAIIAAIGAETGLMGYKSPEGKGMLPWKPGTFPEDMKHFFTPNTTRDTGIVVMGPETYASLPKKFRPLSDRISVVITRNGEYEIPKGDVEAPLHVFDSLGRMFSFVKEKYPNNPIWFAGGPRFMRVALPYTEEILLTRFQENTLPKRDLGNVKPVAFQEITQGDWARQWRRTWDSPPQVSRSGITFWRERWKRLPH